MFRPFILTVIINCLQLQEPEAPCPLSPHGGQTWAARVVLPVCFEPESGFGFGLLSLEKISSGAGPRISGLLGVGLWGSGVECCLEKAPVGVAGVETTPPPSHPHPAMQSIQLFPLALSGLKKLPGLPRTPYDARELTDLHKGFTSAGHTHSV